MAVAACMVLGGTAHAATVPATAKAAIRRPVTITRLRDLDFGQLIATAAAGTAVIDPDLQARSTTGGVIAAGGTPQTAQFAITASANTVIQISRNALPVLTRSGGGATMNVTLLSVDGPTTAIATTTGSFTINIGGELAVAANQAAGTYSGTFQINADYQ